jgi:hypothetical protein
MIASLGAAKAQTNDNSFVGKWKMNPEKSQLTGLTYKIEDAGNGSYSLIFGDRAPETLSSDGKEHKTQYGTVWSLKKTGNNTWKFVVKRDGKVTGDSTWTVSDDGQTFSRKTTTTLPDGKTEHNEGTMKRTDGSGNGLAGIWETTSNKMASPAVIVIGKWQTDGYSLSEPAFKQHLQFKADGKEYNNQGPRVPKGQTVSAKQNGDKNMELTYTLNSKTMQTASWQLSDDGKTLTETIAFPGQSKQEVDVFERQ